MARAPRGREGFALVLALLALMVLAGIASAAVAAAVGQVRAAAMAGRVLAGQAGARAGVETVLEETRGMPSSAIGGTAVELASNTFGTRGSWRVLDLRLAREFHLFIGEATTDGGVPMRDVRVTWWMEPESRVGAHRAVIEAGALSVSAGARVLSDSVLAGRPGLAACHRSPLLRHAFGGPVVQASGGLPSPPEWGATDHGSEFANVRLGWFSASRLRELAEHSLSGGGSLVTGCPGCWLGLVFSSGDMELREEGAGVLAVDGDLAIRPGSSWTGMILVSGDITIAGTGRLLGLVRAGGSVTLAAGSVVDGSACAALRGLNEAISLARPIPLPGRSWVGPVPPATG